MHGVRFEFCEATYINNFNGLINLISCTRLNKSLLLFTFLQPFLRGCRSEDFEVNEFVMMLKRWN